MASIRFSTVLFDWGNTVMIDDPTLTIPMVEWERVEVVHGIESVLEYLDNSGRQIVLATSASVSDEGQIHGALTRAGLDQYFSHIFCFKNTGLPKGEVFYRFILKQLEIQPSGALMVGDSLEKDVLDANHAELHAVWFNSLSGETKESEFYSTVHSMQELLSFFKALDR